MGEWVVPLQDISFVTLLPAHSLWKTGEAQGTGRAHGKHATLSKDLGNKGRREREEAGNSWRREWASNRRLLCHSSGTFHNIKRSS